MELLILEEFYRAGFLMLIKHYASFWDVKNVCSRAFYLELIRKFLLPTVILTIGNIHFGKNIGIDLL
jgi:hypothetical protein